MNEVNPWGSSQIEDYERMRREFGIPEFNFSMDNNIFARRNLIIGHRDFEYISESIKRGNKFYAMTGLMPSGDMHIGNKTVIDLIIYFQTKGADVHIAVADLESYATRGISLERAKELAIENFLLNYIALGLKPCNFYFQSESAKVQRFSYVLSKEVNMSEMKAIYGFEDSKRMLEIESPLIQASDIMSPQIYGGPAPTIVPVGADQDPHIRLTRDISGRMNIFRLSTEKGIEISIGGNDDPTESMKMAEKILQNNRADKIYKNPKYRIIKAEGEDVDLFNLMQDLAIAERKINRFSTIAPSSVIMRLETGIRGGKMSKSVPESTISLNEDPKVAEKKIMRGVTGGRESIEEQKKLGGNPYSCPIFELYLYHLSSDDRDLNGIAEDCISGKRMCGECKREAADRMASMLRDLKEKREEARAQVDQYIRVENEL
ncbi:tryptophan--tRNA ligase [Cuniculiplasma sp. SKW4]|uniref:tryptophan--tRNA ligase n=1 Tax=Cuniculiplasma sp. SKW4 TaxID=3400171 RepID=UPI003FD56E8C